MTVHEVFCQGMECAKKVMPDSPGLVDFTIGLVNSVFNLPEGQVTFFLRNSNHKRTVIIGPVKMSFRLYVITTACQNGNL